MKRYKKLSEMDADDLKDLVTPEMEDFFLKRTYAHIKQVQDNIKRICLAYPEFKSELMKRATYHDKDKFIIPYYYSQILRVWGKYHPDFIRDSDVLELSGKAIFRHIKSNRHHIEFYNRNMSKMQDVDIAEMIADNAAMSKEYHTDLRNWLNKNVFNKYKFSEHQIEMLYNFVDIVY